MPIIGKQKINKLIRTYSNLLIPKSVKLRILFVFLIWLAFDISSFFGGNTHHNVLGSSNKNSDNVTTIIKPKTDNSKPLLSAFINKKPLNQHIFFEHPVYNQGSVSILTNQPNFKGIDFSPVKEAKKKKIVRTPIKKRKHGIRIMSSGRASAKQLASFLVKNNPDANYNTTLYLAKTYIQESNIEGVNHDIAFLQMCLETGFLKFDGAVDVRQNNFCGLGTVNHYTPGESFKTKQEGVQAHIQHLKGYASKDALVGKLVDNRFRFIKRGSAQFLNDLTGKWAADKQYGIKIKGLLKRLDSHLSN